MFESIVCCFFFQAEDGIRDHCVTGVQTCALPILHGASDFEFVVVSGCGFEILGTNCQGFRQSFRCFNLEISETF